MGPREGVPFFALRGPRKATSCVLVQNKNGLKRRTGVSTSSASGRAAATASPLAAGLIIQLALRPVGRSPRPERPGRIVGERYPARPRVLLQLGPRLVRAHDAPKGHLARLVGHLFGRADRCRICACGARGASGCGWVVGAREAEGGSRCSAHSAGQTGGRRRGSACGTRPSRSRYYGASAAPWSGRRSSGAGAASAPWKPPA